MLGFPVPLVSVGILFWGIITYLNGKVSGTYPIFPVVLLILVCASVGHYMWKESGYEKQVRALINQKATFTMTIQSEPTYSGTKENKRIRYIASIECFRYEDYSVRNENANVYLYCPETNSTMLRIGDKIQATGKIRGFKYFRNPGRINTEFRRRANELIGSIYLENDDEIKYLSSKNGFRRSLQNMQHSLQNLFEEGLPVEEANLLNSLLFGGKYDRLHQELVNDFSATGIIHLLSVSGSHIALLFGVLFFIGNCLGFSSKTQFFVSLSVVFLYATLAGWVPPVTRSFLMGTAAMGAIVWKRDANAKHWLGLAICGMLLLNPYLVADISFQLSVGASAGILFYFVRIRRLLIVYLHIPPKIAALIAVTFAAQILLVPILLYYFHSLPFYTVLANLFVTPLLEFVIILGLISTVTGFILKPLALGVLFLTHYIIYTSVYLNSLIASLPGAIWYWRGMQWSEIILYYIFVFLLLCPKKVYIFFSQRRHYVLVPVLILFLLIGKRFFSAYEWRVIVPDIGHSHVVIIERNGHSLLYYKEGAFASIAEFYELVSVLGYLGIRSTDICIYVPAAKESLLTIPVPSDYIIISDNRPSDICIYNSDECHSSQRFFGDIYWQNSLKINISTQGLHITDQKLDAIIATPIYDNKSFNASDTNFFFKKRAAILTSRAEGDLSFAILPPSGIDFARGKENDEVDYFLAHDFVVYETYKVGMIVADANNGKWSLAIKGR